MEYASQTLAADRPARHLERIGSEADRVARLGGMVYEFLARFNGTPREEPQSSGAVAPIAIGYRNDLDRLSANLDQLDNLIQTVIEIG